MQIIYLEKYSIAPSPSRDYYVLRVFQDEIKLFHWRISHGPHKSPLTQNCDFINWKNDKLLQSEIGQIFGKSLLQDINDIIFKRNILLMFPEKLIKKLLHYLSITDIVKLFSQSHAPYEILNNKIVWESISRKIKSDNWIPLDEKYHIAYGWKQFYEEIKDIRLHCEPNKYKNFTISSMTTNSEKKTSSYIKLSPKLQLGTTQTLSAGKNIPGLNEKMNIKPNISLNNSTRKIINGERKCAVNNVVGEVNRIKKNILNIVNLQADDIYIESNTKQLRDAVDMRVLRKKNSDKRKIFHTTIPSKLNYSDIKMPNRITSTAKSTILNPKFNVTAVSSTFKCKDMPPLDDLVNHTIDEFYKPNKVIHPKFNWLNDTSSHDKHNNFHESPKKYDKSLLKNKYKTTLRESSFGSLKSTKNPTLTLSHSQISKKINELSTWQATKLMKLKSSEALQSLKIAEKNIKN